MREDLYSTPCQALEDDMGFGGMMPIAGSLSNIGMGAQIA